MASVASTFMVSRGSISRATDGKIHRLAIVWVLPVVTNAGLPNQDLSIALAWVTRVFLLQLLREGFTDVA